MELNSYFPTWITDAASASSIIGFIVTCFLFVEARKIRHSFMRKARIPEIVDDLDRISSSLISHLKQYDKESRSAHEQIQKATALLESVLPKVQSAQQDKIKRFIDITKNAIDNDLNEDSSWTVSTELSGVVTYLQQIAKDSRWD